MRTCHDPSVINGRGIDECCARILNVIFHGVIGRDFLALDNLRGDQELRPAADTADCFLSQMKVLDD